MEDHTTLTDIIRARISESGNITFADFMNLSLYHPVYGYYSSPGVKIGKRGDYYTSPVVHQVFGEIILKQIIEMWNISGGMVFTIVEMGAGDGTLCLDMLNFAKREYSDFFNNLKYIIIEESEYMKGLQKARLHNAGLLNHNILWTDYSDPLFTTGVNGCFLSNELIDAFPVHIIEKRGGELKEVFVSYKDNSFIEVLDSPSTPELIRYFIRPGIVLEDGQRAEVNLKALEWMRWVARSIRKGFAITVDYGYPAEELYASHRKSGTLLCYYKHMVIEDPYINIGEQDITSHVDFSTLIKVGEEEGMMTLGLTDQMHFLFGLGIGEIIESIGSRADTETEALKQRLLIKNLIMPGRMGEVFKILIQQKGLDNISVLSGLKKNPF